VLTGRNLGAGAAILSPEDKDMADAFSGISANRFGS
jgi:hypothetical protein